MNRHMEGMPMSNDVTTQSSGLVNYNPGQATLLDMRADSSRFPRIKTMPRSQAVDGMSRIVSQAFLYRGQAADPNNIHFIANALVDEILADDKFGAAYISLAEIQVVVKRAVLGGSEMFGISVASLYKVIMDYVKGEGHVNQKKIEEMRRTATDRAVKASATSPMIQAYSGQFIKNHKNR